MIEVEFIGDPMIEIEKYKDNLDDYIFYLNQSSMDAIEEYAVPTVKIPTFFDGLNSSKILFAEGNDNPEEGDIFPDTYIGVLFDTDKQAYKIIGIFADDINYKAPQYGKEVLLKSQDERTKQ